MYIPVDMLYIFASSKRKTYIIGRYTQKKKNFLKYQSVDDNRFVGNVTRRRPIQGIYIHGIYYMQWIPFKRISTTSFNRSPWHALTFIHHTCCILLYYLTRGGGVSFDHLYNVPTLYCSILYNVFTLCNYIILYDDAQTMENNLSQEYIMYYQPLDIGFRLMLGSGRDQ